MSGTSPAASGPGGAHLECQVGAHYLLSMLAQSEPRGLSGTTIIRVGFQGGDDIYPFDDVIIHAQDERGQAISLQIQVKRSIQFTPSDAVFKKVAGQIAKAIQEPAFWETRNELAIAIAKTSRKIDGSYQDVLKWAREHSNATEFFTRLDRPGSANNDMRTFVDTLCTYLKDAGAPSDNEAIWRVLSRLQILVFDFTVSGSASVELALERATRVLPPEKADEAAKLWSTLVDITLEINHNGGDRNREGLIQNLIEKKFQLTGDPRLTNVRALLTEASRHALEDISYCVGSTSLSRSELVVKVRDALDKERYVEIRGDAGVGKSGLLRHFAELQMMEAPVVVLCPSRVTERGWMAMRSQLGFNGTARDLLADLALDGGATIFIDNLDSFNEAERKTVVDLVREAATMIGVSIVATARRNFGVQEPSWLPSEVLDQIGRAPAIFIDELSETEVSELAAGEPKLAGLMRENHPARNVVRNLFRLSRIVNRPTFEQPVTTELEMAEQWWTSADGRTDDGTWRERARVLRAISEQILGGAHLIDVTDQCSEAVDALIKSETLTDHGQDKVTFRHDVLREWAIGNLLNEDPSHFSKLKLEGPPSAIMTRGIEFAARFALERQKDGKSWGDMLGTLGDPANNPSWRRAALLAIVHSEMGLELLKRETDRLLANEGNLLRGLIRAIIAVDVDPASNLYKAASIPPPPNSDRIFVPNNPSWQRMIFWLLDLGAKIPAQALSDVVELYYTWMIALQGNDNHFTPLLLPWLHAWLVEMEGEDDLIRPGVPSQTYTGPMDHRVADDLIDRIRLLFLAFCQLTPVLAADYLKRVMAQTNNDRLVENIFRFCGSLAQAAPKELAEMTEKALISYEHSPDRRESEYHDQGPFKSIDSIFLPESPAQGPFLDLLTHAPVEGLALVRRLVAHGVDFLSKGRDPGENGFRLQINDEERFFPYYQTFEWSRGYSNFYALTSALMALEAWAHKRLEDGESFDVVLADVLGPPGTSAAFLLPAIDLILSHWPKSGDAAIPFLVCPELLSIDLDRYLRDQREYPDLFGLNEFLPEPSGSNSMAVLKGKASRRTTLKQVLGYFALFCPADQREKMVATLEVESLRLGAYEPRSGTDDPSFMVRHAINLLDPANWREGDGQREDNTRAKGYEYISPEMERKHLEAHHVAVSPHLTDATMIRSLSNALDNPDSSSPELAHEVASWAQDSAQKVGADADENELKADAILSAAFITLRDGSDKTRAEYGGWAKSILIAALSTRDDVVHWVRKGLNYNPIAKAFAGLAELYCRSPEPATLRILLEVAARKNPAGAHGFIMVAPKLAAADERLPKAILRCGLTACLKPSLAWDISEEEKARRNNRYQQQLAQAVDAEIVWLTNAGREPSWPFFSAASAQKWRRRRLHISGQPVMEPPEEIKLVESFIDDQAAALWLSGVVNDLDNTARPWALDLCRSYSDFTSLRNGAGFGTDEEISNSPGEWNAAYYKLLAWCVEGLDDTEVDALAINPIISLPDQCFYDVMPYFLFAIDSLYFNYQKLERTAPYIRKAFANRLSGTHGWKRLAGDKNTGIEFHIGPCIASLFFNEHRFSETSSYLKPKAIDRIDAFLPTLLSLVQSGPNFFVALITLDLLELSPRPILLPLAVTAANSWLRSYPEDQNFWMRHTIGKRFCQWIDALHAQTPAVVSLDKPERTEIDRILAALVSLGIPEARQLEKNLIALL